MINYDSINQTVLGKIVADKLEWIAARKVSQPLASFEAALTPSDRSFYDALRQHRTVFILECKKASPSKGLIREDFDPAAIARVYGDYASAISVLTDEKYFQGNFDFLPRVRAEVNVPVLCKDFVVDPYQIQLARHHQADAVLLMLSVLTDEAYRQLAAVAHGLNMGVLTEVSNEDELARAIALDAQVVGINNRNLRDLTIDLDRTRQLAPQLPSDRIVICESGIYHHHQVKDLSHYANGFLVGSSLMSQPDVAAACRALILGQNKVCGLTRAQDAAAACQAGALFGGLIFVEKSPRHVTTEQARLVMAGAPLQYVGVFQNAPLQAVADTARELNLAAVQLHGQEDADYLQALRPLLPEGCLIWKALAVSDHFPQAQYQALSPLADRLLLDSKVAGQCGGTGQAFDWQLLDKLDKSQLMLAGGLTPENAAQAAALGCQGLDFNSGVESAPGLKDADKLQRAFAALRAY